ncbi:hypothetical protein ZOSMA_458G00030 [Zostera marina]|uniref:Uncharacterized protein n=1 Tax=Zostera marina TaxID=29655 RepID=A0A0K9P0F6_ZOSMR|nr:hypothetical protein ZOSMA_458G00030 [Zostera marina]
MRKEEMGDRTNLIFSYGTLDSLIIRRLKIDFIRTGDASFVRVCKTSSPYPLVCGPYRVLFHKGKWVYRKFNVVTSFGLGSLRETPSLP